MKQFLPLMLLLLSSLAAQADEGMWMIGNLDKATRRSMKELGLELSAKQLYDPRRPSLKDAVVSFGGFCSGVVVSADGLVLTNHHCGMSQIQQHSSVEHDYLQDGFIARTRDEELPNPELYVRFLVRTEEVTRRVLKGITPGMDEARRAAVIDSISLLIEREAVLGDTTLVAIVSPFYAGNEFRLDVYRDYDDVRLVYAPPTSVGRFGWDTDNWMWPRHTGDFSLFRIYADSHNRPASYSPDNRPYHPRYVAPLSTAGYREGDFCMTIGYPGTTERYLTSYGIEEMMQGDNQAQIDVRGVKQAIWKEAMERSDSIRIRYASKYDESSNYWKNSIGVNRAIVKLDVLRKKRDMEERVRQWIRDTPAEREQLLTLFTDLELSYKNRREAGHARSYFIESFLNAAELPQLALSVLNFDAGNPPDVVAESRRQLLEQYANFDADLDKAVFTAMLRTYRAHVAPQFLPDFYHTIDTRYHGDEQAFADTLYAHSLLTSPEGFYRTERADTTYHVIDDPAVSYAIDLLAVLFDLNGRMSGPTEGVERGERLYNAATRRMYAHRNFYPDANMTMRLSFGTVASYQPADGIRYGYYTTTRGILEKARQHAGERDFMLQPELRTLLSSDEAARVPVCFITNNDITGGNSGSAMFNARGQLLGLAFDGNWEAMSGDILYDPLRQRCIGVDVRYILFIMQHYGRGAAHLVDELTLRSK